MFKFRRAATIIVLTGIIASYIPAFIPYNPFPPQIKNPIPIIKLIEDFPPLSSFPKITTKTKTKTQKKIIKLKTPSKKTYTKKTKPKTTLTTNTKTTENETIKTNIITKIQLCEKCKKNSKKKIITKTTTITTTIIITERTIIPIVTPTPEKTIIDIQTIAPLMPQNIIKAFQTLNFQIIIDPTVSYSGLFMAKDKKITLKQKDTTIYHELGHFLAFVAGRIDISETFKRIYETEKDLFPGEAKIYAISNPSEYFAEAVREYIFQYNRLAKACPLTTNAIDTAIAKVTDEQIAKINRIYSVYWK